MKKLKSAEEYYNDYNLKCYRGVCNKELFSKREMLELIKQAQLDAIQTTVKNCAEEADANVEFIGWLNENKEVYNIQEGQDYEVRVIKSSILNVAEKRKEKLDENN